MTASTKPILALLALAACVDSASTDPHFVTDCIASVDQDVTTRARVKWTSKLPGPSWVEFDLGQTPVMDNEATEHEAVLLGLPQLTETTWRAVTDGEIVCEGTLTTGALPTTVPGLSVTVYNAERASPEAWLFGASLSLKGMVYILNRAGDIVWYAATDEGRSLFDVEPLPGGRVSWNVADAQFQQDEAEIVETVLTGGTPTRWQTELGHHAFAATPTGFAYMMLDIRPWFDVEKLETYDVAGDAVVLVDREGDHSTLWSTWDAFDVEGHEGWTEGLYDGIADWTHGNSLSWSEERGTLLYSTPVLRTLVEISSTGTIQTFGPKGTYHVADPDDSFSNQHGSTWTEAGTLLMFMTAMNGNGTGAMEYEIDEATRSYKPIWSYGFGLGILNASLGGAQRLQNGNTLVNFGASGMIREVTPDGTVVWEVVSDLGIVFGEQVMIHDLYGRDVAG